MTKAPQTRQGKRRKPLYRPRPEVIANLVSRGIEPLSPDQTRPTVLDLNAVEAWIGTHFEEAKPPRAKKDGSPSFDPVSGPFHVQEIFVAFLMLGEHPLFHAATSRIGHQWWKPRKAPAPRETPFIFGEQTFNAAQFASSQPFALVEHPPTEAIPIWGNREMAGASIAPTKTAMDLGTAESLLPQLLSSVAALEMRLAAIEVEQLREAPPQIGHNNPPASIDEPPLTRSEVRTIKSVLKRLPAPGSKLDRKQAKKLAVDSVTLTTIAARVGSWVASVGADMAKQFGKEFASTSGKWAARVVWGSIATAIFNVTGIVDRILSVLPFP